MEPEARDNLWTRDFILLAGSTLLFWASFLFFMPALPLFMLQRLHSNPAEVGLVTGLMALTAMLARPFAGYATDRWGRRRVYLGSLLAFTLATLGHTLCHDLLALVLVHCLYGLPFGFVTACSMAVGGDVAPPSRRGEALGILVVAQTAAMAIGPVVALAVLGQGSFGRLFVVAGAVALAAEVLGWPIRYPDIRDPHARLSLRSVFEPGGVPVALTVTFLGLGYGGIVSFIALYGQQLSVTNLGFFYLLYAVGQAVARAAAGRVFDREGARRIVPLGFLLVMAGYTLLALWRIPLGFLVAAFIYGLGWGLFMPSLQTMAINQVAPPRRGAASATFYNGFDLGVSSGSYAMAFVAQAVGGYAGMYLVAAALVLIALLLFFTWSLPRYRPWRP
jgi:predicted MFS family arabinose efflux permease